MRSNRKQAAKLSDSSQYTEYTGKPMTESLANTIDLFFTSSGQLARCEKLIHEMDGGPGIDSPEPEVKVLSESSDTQKSFHNSAISSAQGQDTHRLIKTPVPLNPAAKGLYPLSNSMGCAYPVQQVLVTDSKQKPPINNIQNKDIAKEAEEFNL